MAMAATASPVANTELDEALSRICRVVRHLVQSYEESKEPDKLDLLVFQVDRLYRLLLPLDIRSDQVLEAISASLCLLQELNEYMGCEYGYIPQVCSIGVCRQYC